MSTVGWQQTVEKFKEPASAQIRGTRTKKHMRIVLKKFRNVWRKHPQMALCELLQYSVGFHTMDDNLFVMQLEFCVRNSKKGK